LCLLSRLHPRIWSVKNLPSDSFRLIPCRAPLGGALVVTQNAILYINQTQYFGLSTNAFAQNTINQNQFPVYPSIAASINAEPINIMLRGCQYDYFNQDEILFSMPDGGLYLLSLPTHEVLKHGTHYGGEQCQLALRKIGSSVPTTCVSVDSSKGLVFLGSRDSDSVLLSYSEINNLPETHGKFSSLCKMPCNFSF